MQGQTRHTIIQGNNSEISIKSDKSIDTFDVTDVYDTAKAKVSENGMNGESGTGIDAITTAAWCVCARFSFTFPLHTFVFCLFSSAGMGAH